MLCSCKSKKDLIIGYWSFDSDNSSCLGAPTIEFFEDGMLYLDDEFYEYKLLEDGKQLYVNNDENGEGMVFDIEVSAKTLVIYEDDEKMYYEKISD